MQISHPTNSKMKRSILARALPNVIFTMVVCATACTANATGLVYTPVNPTFGGNPLNGGVLLDDANAQNKYKDPSTSDLTSLANQTPLEQFNTQLQQAILSQVASSATSAILGPNGKLQPGTIQTGTFAITISDLGNGSLQVSTTDKTTGAVTSFVVGQ